jgi:hypothetical protein
MHDLDAVAVCAYCGRGVCSKCGRTEAAQLPGTGGPAASFPPRISCSEACSSALRQMDANVAQLSAVAQQLLRQSVRNAKASAFYCYLGCLLSGSAAVVAWFILPSDFLIFFTTACAVVLLISGIWYSKAAKKERV